MCLRLLTITPKKPNSANRRVAKVKLNNFTKPITVKIPGEQHQLQQHSVILIKGASVRDLIGVKQVAIRGKFDLSGVAKRKTARSSYGVKLR